MAQSHSSSTLHGSQLVWRGLEAYAHQHFQAARTFLVYAAFSALGFAVANLLLLTLTWGRVMPFTVVNGVHYGFMSQSEAVNKLVASHAGTTLVIYNEGTPITLGAVESGVQLRAHETLTAGAKGWGAVPVFHLLSNIFGSTDIKYSVNQQQLAAALSPHVPTVRTDATEARVIMPSTPDGEIKIVEGVPGQEMTPEIAAQQVAYEADNSTFAVRLTPATVAPRWNKGQVLALLPQIEAARRSTLTIQTADATTVVEIAGLTLQEMLVIETDNSVLGVTLDTSKLSQYLDKQANLFYVAPVATRIGLLDGIEISRTDGVVGRMLDSQKTAESVAAAFSQGILIGEALVATIQPDTLYTRNYSNSDQGLYKIIEDFAASHKGTFSVGVVELEGSGNRSAFYNADTRMIAASTYKMFVAYAAMLKVESGEWTLSTETSAGSLDDCIKDMIVVSDNTCPIAILDKLGWAKTDALLKEKGYSGTQMSGYGTGDKYTTARDQIKLLSGMYFGETLQKSSRDYLFGHMKEQIYRSGIPAGSGSSIVADKVGFLYGLNHDMGIVYGPKSTYALVILTDGAGGFKPVSDLSQKIYDFYNQ